ncbi:MAG TPA: polyprenyl synthetase family protein [Polyangia bacterium]|nr:polyprenyl synthetase family protein [Polyangia bacterium]
MTRSDSGGARSTPLEHAANAGAATSSSGRTSPALSPTLAGWLETRREELARIYDRHLAQPKGGDPGRLVEAMRYSLLAPGKRIRPLLALAAAEMIAPPDDQVRLACAAVELVHCYSLIHDDLPAMDDDDFRRGRPSNHKAFGEATAILAGDALLTLAFEWIAEAGGRAPHPEGYLRAARALAEGAGPRGMVRGQARDLGEAPPATLGDLEILHGEKTAALFRAALEVGAQVAGAPPETVAALGHFGTLYGIAFQHADDRDDAEHAELRATAHQRLLTLVAEACATVTDIAPSPRSDGQPTAASAASARLVEIARALLP